jgi:hypothetical protein
MASVVLYNVCSLSSLLMISVETSADMRLAQQCNITTALVYSDRRNINKRLDIRNSWAHWFESVHFFLGDRDCEIPPSFREPSFSCFSRRTYNETLYEGAKRAHVQAMLTIKHSLRQENAVYKDMVFLPMVDYYDNLPEKFFESLKWILGRGNSSGNPFLILKIDDDATVTHVRGLLEEICQHVRSMGSATLSRPVLFGTFMEDYIHRRGKYASLRKADQRWYFAKWDTFPFGGNGYAMTPVLANTFVEHRHYLSQDMTQLEDVNIGMWIPRLKEHFNVTVTKVAVGQDRSWWEKVGFHMYTSFLE